MAGGSSTRARSTTETGDETEKLINKVCSNFCSQLEAKFNHRFDKIEDKLTELSQTLKSLSLQVGENKKAIHKIDISIDELEQFSKRNTLRIHGLPEDQSVGCEDIVVKFLSENFQVGCDIRDIDCAFRVGDSEGDKPRPIIVNFVQNFKKTQIFQSKKALKGTGFAIFEDLTKKRYELMLSAKRKFGKNNVWSPGGKIIVWNAAERKKSILNLGDDL